MYNTSNLSELSEKFLDRHLSEEEGLFLAELLENDSEVSRQFCDNFICDYLLRDRYQRQRNMYNDLQTLVCHVGGSDAETPDTFDFVPLEELLSETVRWEKVIHHFESTENGKPLQETTQDPQVWAPATICKPLSKQTSSESRLSREKRWRSNLFFAIRLICFVFAIVWLCRYEYNVSRHSGDVPQEEFHAVAQISETIDAVWEKETEQFSRGQETTARKMSLARGIVQVKFGSGSKIIVEGPAELVLNDSNRVFCSSGKISAIVPPEAVGFEVRTPFGNVLDLGTEFFVHVDKNGTEVSTIQGQVQWNSLNQASQLLTEGKSARTDSLGKITWPDFVSKDYIGTTDFLTRLANHTQREVEKKMKLEAAYDQTPSLIARFDLAGSGTEVANLATRGRDLCPQLTVANCSVGEGRLYGLKATRFDRRDSAARLNGNISSKSMTLSVSVQLEHLKNWGNVLFASSPTLDKQGDFLWQISREGELILWIKSSDGALVDTYSSPPYFKRENWGVWFDITVVADANRKTVAHYVNGKQIAVLPWNNPVPLRIASGTLGNIPAQKGRLGERFLSGAMDAFRIYNDAVVPE